MLAFYFVIVSLSASSRVQIFSQLPCMFDSTSDNDDRYGRVIAVVGMNPKKHYKVTPHERANLIRKMLRHHQIVNVQAQGKQSSTCSSGDICSWRTNRSMWSPFISLAVHLVLGIRVPLVPCRLKHTSRLGLRVAPRQTTRSPHLLSRHSKLATRRAGGATPANPQHMGSFTAGAAGLAPSDRLLGRSYGIQSRELDACQGRGGSRRFGGLGAAVHCRGSCSTLSVAWTHSRHLQPIRTSPVRV